VTPDEMRERALSSNVPDHWRIAAEFCTRLDALVAAGERQATALELIARRMPWRAKGDTEP
jgi:hypothetical protein